MPAKKRPAPQREATSSRRVRGRITPLPSNSPSPAPGPSALPLVPESSVPPQVLYAPVIDDYIDNQPGSSQPRRIPKEDSNSVTTVFQGREAVDLQTLTDAELLMLATGNISDLEETDDSGDELGSDGEEEVVFEWTDEGEQFSDLILVEQVRSLPTDPPRSPLHTLSPTPRVDQEPANPPSPPPVRPSSTAWSADPVSPPSFPFNERPGLKISMGQQEPEDFFKLMFTDNFVQNIIEETNRNAEHIFLQSSSPRARISDWKPLTFGDFYIFLGLLFHMGNVIMAQIRDYWRTDRFFRFPFFSDNMSRDRFEGILRTLYFNQRPPPDQEPPEDRLYKLRPVLDHFNERMDAIYYPHREMSIDESMILWRGRLVFRQYIKSKRHKYGVKMYILAEKSGLVQRVIIYTGKADNVAPKGQSHAQCVVDKLINKFKYKGHSLYMDNFFSSLDIVTHLMNCRLFCTCTLRGNRKGNPKDVVTARLGKGQVKQMWNEDGICVLKWRDKRDVLMISSEHTGNLEETQNRRGQVSSKPKAVIEYNKHMGGTDRLDQLMSYYMTNRKTIKWYRKVVIHFWQIMLNNAYLLYKSTPNLGKKVSIRDFRLAIVGYLVDEGRRINGPVPALFPTVQQRHVCHYPEDMPFRKGSQSKRVQKDCRVCTTKGIRKGSSFFCPLCPGNPGLCPSKCFKTYHENK